MSTVLGVNAVFHDPAAALLVDGEVVGPDIDHVAVRPGPARDCLHVTHRTPLIPASQRQPGTCGCFAGGKASGLP